MSCSASVQIFISFYLGKKLFQGSKYGYATQIPDLAVSAEFCLTLSQVGKDITSGILGVSLCMSIKA
jgi:hypothetical protein